jgi:ribosomal protein L12E/L44/L45/RPP1/RPP2
VLGLKSLLPIIGGVAGFFGGPAASAAVNAALGSGIGTLLAGGDVKDAIKNAALSLSGLAGSGATAAGFGPEAAAKATAKAAAEKKVLETAAAEELSKQVAEKGVGSKLLDFLKTPTGILTGGGLAALLAGEEDENELTELQKRQLATGERVPDYIGQNIVQEFDYPLAAAEGGYIQGPGTGRSDSINAGIFQNGQKVQEARLSDGEFVMTERAVRGMGDGDREKGAARMYEIMKKYERVA